MRVVCYIERPTGVNYHRLIMPLMLMQAVDVYITNNLLEEHFEKGCDVFIYSRVLPNSEAYSKIYELQDKYNFKIVVDVDDYWVLDETHILNKMYKEVDYTNQQIYSLRNADIILTTNKYLLSEIIPFNPNVFIVPNAIPKHGQFNITKVPCDYTRLFWQGSVTHAEDLSLLDPVSNALSYLSKDIKMVIAGFSHNDPEWNKMCYSYTAQFKHQYKIIEGKPVAEYYKHYEEADICLVPLLNTKFNRCKSNLKILEAANLGLPVICSLVGPYLDMPVIYAKSISEWVNNIDRLVNSKKRQKEAGEKLKSFCDINFNFEKINNKRKNILENACRKQTIYR